MTVITLASLDGASGFRIGGIDNGDVASVVGGAVDINGDGIDDLIIGAPVADPAGRNAAGETYVIFGRTDGFGSTFDLRTLDGTNGFRLNGVDVDDRSGGSVSGAGDINGDGIDDLIIGASNAAGGAGESYVVFGKASGFAASINLAGLNGSNGFRIDGVALGDGSGGAVSGAGDVNGDGVDDLIIGAHRADRGGNRDVGESYIVFGNTTGFARSVDLSALDGSNGFRIDAASRGERTGDSVSGAGDFNGDGVEDFIISASGANPNNTNSAGESYVVFGRSSGFGSTFDLDSLNGTNGFRLQGINDFDFSGGSVSGAGDVNGDGFDDVIISGRIESYVIFGKAGGFSSSLDLGSLNGRNGFRLEGSGATSVSNAGDFNGDGFDDLLIGNNNARPDGLAAGGEAYLVFGQANGFSASINLNNLDGSDGFRIPGESSNGFLGSEVSAIGDLNADGFDDIAVGASGATIDGARSGASYVIFGFDKIQQNGTAASEILDGTIFADEINGLGGNDRIRGLEGDDILRGNAGDDRIVGAAGEDALFGGTGEDSLFGGGRGDIIDGGADRDKLRGQGGADVFSFSDGDFSGTGGTDSDRILDFGLGADVIDLSLVDAVAGGSDDAFAFRGTSGFSGSEGELRYVQFATHVRVFGDTDGDRVADFAIRLDGTHTLVESDFVL